MPVPQSHRDNARGKKKSWSRRGRDLGGEEDEREGKEEGSVRGRAVAQQVLSHVVESVFVYFHFFSS